MESNKESLMILLEFRKLMKNSTHARTNAGEKGREVLQSRPAANDATEAANNCRSIAWLLFDNKEFFIQHLEKCVESFGIELDKLDDTEYVKLKLKEVK